MIEETDSISLLRFCLSWSSCAQQSGEYGPPQVLPVVPDCNEEFVRAASRVAPRISVSGPDDKDFSSYPSSSLSQDSILLWGLFV